MPKVVILLKTFFSEVYHDKNILVMGKPLLVMKFFGDLSDIFSLTAGSVAVGLIPRAEEVDR